MIQGPALALPAELLAGEVAGVFLVFARVGAALMIVPGFGEHYVLPRLRLALALLLSLILAPAVVGTATACRRSPSHWLCGSCRSSVLACFWDSRRGWPWPRSMSVAR